MAQEQPNHRPRPLLVALAVACLLAFVPVPVAVQGQQPGGAETRVRQIPRSYSVPPEQLDQIVAQLRAQFPVPQSRIAAEPRSSRIIVMASSEVQQHVEAMLRQMGGTPLTSAVGPPATPPQADAPRAEPWAAGNQAGPAPRTEADVPRNATPPANPAGPAALGGEQVERRINLPEPRQQFRIAVRNRKVGELQQQITQIWGRRVGQAETANHTLDLQLPGVKGDVVDLSADHVQQQFVLTGGMSSIDSWSKVIAALDQPAEGLPSDATSVLAPQAASSALPRIVAALQQGLSGSDAIRLLRMGRTGVQFGAGSVQTLLQNGNPGESDPNAETTNAEPLPNDEPQQGDEPNATGTPSADGGGGLIGPVQIYFLEGLDGVIVRGNQRDVDRVTQIIADIERLSTETTPEVRVLALQHVQSLQLSELIRQIYTEVLANRQGDVSITALVKPNSLLLIGRAENVKIVVDLVQQLDQPVQPDSQFQVIQLKHMSALDAQQTINDFYAERGGLGPSLRIAADYRSNALVIQGGPRDLVEVSKLIERMDTAESAAVNEVRVFRLKNALADELVPVLEEAFRIDQESLQGGAGGGGAGGFGAAGGQTGRLVRPKSSILTLFQLDAEGKRLLRSGILADARVSADARANAIVVTAPTESMELIAALIAQLDALPGAEAQIKVFTVDNGDAVSLAEMLQELFGQADNQGNQNGPAVQTAGAGEEGTLVPLRFTVDERTNTIIASGSLADLEVVEAILLKLDEDDSRQRQSTVYRLRNSYAVEVADAINEFLRSERTVQEINPNAVSPFEQIEREVVVVAQESTNALIISATPRYYQEIMKLIRDLDERPPMVMIQVLIAEVTLNNLEELGVELGLQDSFLFDRGVIANNTITPGFNFNNQPLGNASSAASLASAGNIGSQGLSNFALGRTNSNLGYGGLVLSASSDSVNILVRALEQEGRLNVLSRPQIMTLDNQYAFVQVGQQVPYITNSSVNTAGVTTNSTQFLDTGILLQVQPRISPDGLVVMIVEATKSDVSAEEGIPISVSTNGVVIRAPIFNTTRAHTVVSARNGQTVVLSGLITTQRSEQHRGVPYLSDIPLLGRLFQFDSLSEERTELLFIMTPYIVKGDEDVEWLKAVETDRMHWCLSDVAAVHGDLTGTARPVTGGPQVIYPDGAPSPEMVPVPELDVPSATGVEIPNLGTPGGPGPALDETTQRRGGPPTMSSMSTMVRGSELVPVPPPDGRPRKAVALQTARQSLPTVDMGQPSLVRTVSLEEQTASPPPQSAPPPRTPPPPTTPANRR